MNKIKIMETCLRDGHQSLMATRMTTAEMLPIIEKLDSVGYHSLEMWGRSNILMLPLKIF